VEKDTTRIFLFKYFGYICGVNTAGGTKKKLKAKCFLLETKPFMLSFSEINSFK